MFKRKKKRIELASYERDCDHCEGEGMVEHTGEGISEKCEHCDGTGRKNKLTDAMIFSKNFLAISLNS